MTQGLVLEVCGSQNNDNDIWAWFWGVDDIAISELPDNFVVSSFCESYSEKYKDLLPEQKDLLTKYIISSGDSSVDFKVHLSETLRHLQKEVERSLDLSEVKEDKAMVESTKNVIEYLNSINVATFSDSNMLKVLKIQSLVNEYKSDVD